MALGIMSLHSASLAADDDFAAPWRLCRAMIESAERVRTLPRGLLYSVALVESGRSYEGSSLLVPWPWTLRSGREGMFFETRQEAQAKLDALIAAGETNIDIGCMQINYFFHRRAFENVADMLNPLDNVAYATQYLLLLYERHGNWERALSFYHSSDLPRGRRYSARVMRFLADERATRFPLDETAPIARPLIASPSDPESLRLSSDPLIRSFTLLVREIRQNFPVLPPLPSGAEQPDFSEDSAFSRSPSGGSRLPSFYFSERARLGG